MLKLQDACLPSGWCSSSAWHVLPSSSLCQSQASSQHTLRSPLLLELQQTFRGPQNFILGQGATLWGFEAAGVPGHY